MASHQVYQDGTQGVDATHGAEKKPGIVEKIKDMLPGHKDKTATDTYGTSDTTGATGTHTTGGAYTTGTAPTTHTHHTTGTGLPTTHHTTGTTGTTTGYGTTGTTTGYDTLTPVNERSHGIEAASGGDRYAAGYLPGQEVGVGGEERKGILPTIKGMLHKDKTGTEHTTGVTGVNQNIDDGGYQHGGIAGTVPPTGYAGATPATGTTGQHQKEGIVPKVEHALGMDKNKHTGTTGTDYTTGHNTGAGYTSGTGGYATAGSAPGGVGTTVASTPVGYGNTTSPAVGSYDQYSTGQGATYGHTVGTGYQQGGVGEHPPKEGIIPKVEHALGMDKNKHTDTTGAGYNTTAGGYQQTGYEQGGQKEGIVAKAKDALGIGAKHGDATGHQSGAGGYTIAPGAPGNFQQGGI